MWNKLSHCDLDAAKQQLNSQREEMLRKHAEELSGLESDLAEIETLDQLIGTFARKFGGATAILIEPATYEIKNFDQNNSEGAHVASRVSLFITQAQKHKLRELGIADEQIRDMKPYEAHRILGLAS